MKITIANQKGGVSKSTTAAALACALHKAGKKTLAIDADPQASLSYLLGADPNAPGLLDAIRGTVKPADAIQQTEQADIMAGNNLLAVMQEEIRAETLREILQGLKKYRYIIIDTGPGLNRLLLSALAAADKIIIPAKANAGSLQGIIDTYNTAVTVKKKGACAVLMTQTHTRQTNAERAFSEAIRETCAELALPVLDTAIRYAEAPITSGEAFRESIVQYDPKSKPAQDYFRLLEEMKL